MQPIRASTGFMFSIFEKLFDVSVGRLNLFTKTNSPSIKQKVDYGKNNVFVNQGVEVTPRSQGPYALFRKSTLRNKDEEWIKFHHEVWNLGSEPANNAKTHTEIFIDGEIKFKSPITASSIIPPDTLLDIVSEDPIELVKKCTHEKPNNRYVLIVEYEDVNGNKFVTIRACFYLPNEESLSTREEKAFKI